MKIFHDSKNRKKEKQQNKNKQMPQGKKIW